MSRFIMYLRCLLGGSVMADVTMTYEVDGQQWLTCGDYGCRNCNPNRVAAVHAKGIFESGFHGWDE